MPCGHAAEEQEEMPELSGYLPDRTETHSETIALSSVAKAVFPKAYQQRVAEVEAEKASWDTILPIFFYNDTLFPFSPLALNLFEPRYKVMLHRIVESSRKFAYLPKFDTYQANVGDMGVIAEITDIEFLADGRAHLQAKCRERFTIKETWIEDGTQGLHWCKVELVHDGRGGDDEGGANDSLEEVVADCDQLFANVMARSSHLAREIESQYGSRPSDPERFSFWLSSILPVPYGDKHSLLTCLNTKQRLSLCRDLMRAFL
eukprot:CAMPEP_0173445108 /NCGR_PEP_ID=MMETSP1357-20121228/33607_1 /TAXON_ID=77926 /ORGANISM="Hemiselmis rufescens, Strain PCC563" /LENGTH=260 /DNA_ID=CAMNT_0014411241 /DNA_START=38 /DNA_END=821 /DNA_ORIENTATION=+